MKSSGWSSKYFGYLKWRADSLEKTLMLGKIYYKRRGGDRGWDGRITSLIQWIWIWANPGRNWKGKGERKRYTKLNAEFQRLAGRNKKAFLSEKCKEIKENNRVGKTRDLFKNIGDIKWTFHAKMSTVKERNSKDLTEVEEIRTR